MEYEPSAPEAEAPLSVEDMLRAEEEEDEEILEAVVSDLRTRQSRSPLLLPPPPTSSPPFIPHIRDGGTQTEDASISPPRAEEVGTSGERPPSPSPVSEVPPPAEAGNLMERVQRLLGSIIDRIPQPTPFSRQAAIAEPRGLADLLEATQQLKAFLDLPNSEVLSPLGETRLNSANALVDQVLGVVNAPISFGIQVQQLLRDASLLVTTFRILSSKRRTNQAVLSR